MASETPRKTTIPRTRLLCQYLQNSRTEKQNSLLELVKTLGDKASPESSQAKTDDATIHKQSNPWDKPQR